MDARILKQSPFLEVELEVGGDKVEVIPMLVGAYNLQNIRLAAATGYRFGVSMAEIAEALARYRPENQQVPGGRG